MITLENNVLKVQFNQGRALKIISFLDKRHNKEWVWTPENIENDSNADQDLKSSFDSRWTGGWEEIFPNDAPCDFEEFSLVDHGEVWRKRWKIQKSDSHYLEASFECETMPFTLSKRIGLDPNNPLIDITYNIKNNSMRSLPYLFKFHPALKIEKGDRFILPPSKMKPVALPFSRLIGHSEETNFPTGIDPQGKPVRIDVVRDNDGYSREFVKISHLDSGECALFNPRTQTELRFNFSLENLPYVWLFQSYGGFMDHYVAMLEPTNAFHYDLAHLQENNMSTMIEAHQDKSFSLSVSIREL